MDSAITPHAPVLQERLDALLVEVNGLANRLKSTDPTATLPSASRAALQLLQRHGPQTVPQIARARFSSRQNIQILINRLQQEGLVEFVTNPDHKRSALVRLTNHGQAAIAEAGKVLAELNTKILPSFSQSELSSATEVLSKLRALLRPRDVPARRGTEMVGGPSLSEQQLTHENSHPANEQPVSGFGSPLSDEGGLPVSLL
jgi:DNA-binding MarR family transcriptional regulator